MKAVKSRSGIWRDWLRPVLIVAVVLGSFRSAIADWNDVPTGSMKPTILEYERIFVNRAAYDLRVPFTTWSVWRLGAPERGDIVVLISPHDGRRLVKRIVGLPGDLIELRANRLFINHQPVHYALPEETPERETQGNRSAGVVVEERLTNRQHAVLLLGGPCPMASFGPRRVPQDHYFVMGDNRNDSFDSRYWGFVERGRILGRATRVVLSFDPERHFRPRLSRFLTPLI